VSKRVKDGTVLTVDRPRGHMGKWQAGDIIDFRGGFYVIADATEPDDREQQRITLRSYDAEA
jgi:hypothetical protein